MNKMTARFSAKLLSWLLVLAMILSLLPMSALAAEDKQTPPTQILKCETNFGYDFKLTFSSESSDWLLSVKSVTVANTSYTEVDSSYSVWNDTDYYIGGDYLMIGEGFTGASATCVIEAEGYSALTLTLDKTVHSAVIVSAQEPETGGDSGNGDGTSEDEGKEPEQGDATSAVTVPEFSNVKNSYYILAFQTQNYVSGISKVLVNSQECQEGSSATFLSGTQYYKNTAENKLYLANTQWGSDPTFQNGDIITIQNPSYQDLVLKVTIAGDTVNIGPDDGGDEDAYTLHVRLVGSFEAALVGQEDYDAVSSASTNVTTNKNSNVEVQGALIQGNEPVSSDWKPLNQLGITVNRNTTSVSISPDDSGMVGVYSIFDSALTLAGTPEKAGSYQISVTVSDGQGRTATSNELSFNVYSGDETLEDRLTLDNCTQTSDGKYMWDMEPWAISAFGGTGDTVTVPTDLKAWYGSHTSGTYGELGYAVDNEAAPTQTLIVPDGCNLTMVNMDVLSSVKIVVQSGGKLVLRDSVIQGIVEVEDGGAFSMNYNDYGEGTFESGASINGQLILKDGATLENSSIYSNTNYIANGDEVRRNAAPVVSAEGNVTVKGQVFIRGDEAPTGSTGQAGLSVKNGTLELADGALLAVYGGGQYALTATGGAAIILDNGTITGNGKLISVGGGGYLEAGGDAVQGAGTISTKEAYLQGGSVFGTSSGSYAPGLAKTNTVNIADTTQARLIDGVVYTSTADNPNTPYWSGTEAPTDEFLAQYEVSGLATTSITVDGKETEHTGEITFDTIRLTNKTLFPAGADDAYLVTIGTETKLLGDTTLKRWVGTWESWQPWTSSDETVKAAMDARYPLINDVWELAYPAYINAFKGTALESMIQTMYPNVDSLKTYWYNMTGTNGVASIQVTEEDGGSYKLSWLDNDGDVLAADSYTMTGKVLNGLEGATMYVFTADTLTNSDYKYFVTMEPDMEGEEETPIAAHYHFQFGSDLSAILAYGEHHNAIEKNETTGRAVSDMKNTKWYATMINAGASDLAKYNVVLAMHRADKFTTADDVLPGIAGESGTTYMPLFDCILKDEYNSYWHDYCAAVAGDNGNLTQLVEYLQQSCNGNVYGQEGLTQYCCDFINGAESITVNGNRITVKNSAGNTISDSEYTYQGPVTIGDPNTLYHFTAYLYRAVGSEVSEDFRYFLFRDDAPDTTYHIEFRYGSNLDALKGLVTGKYAYWLAAGIPVNADETMIENCIALFCVENQDYSAERSAESVAQIADFVGTWDYSADGGKTTSPDLLHFTVDSNGNGTSYYYNKVSSQYQVFAYDNDGSSAAKSGIYISFNGEEFTWADYSITVSGGKTILTFTGYEDGQPYTLTYVKHQSGEGVGGGSSSSGSSGSSSSSSSSSGGSSSSSSNTATTKNPDGSITTTTTDKKTGTVTETTKTTDGTIGTVVTNKDGEVTEVKATVSSAAVTEAAKNGEAVTLPVEVPTAKSTEDAPAVQVSVPKSVGSVKVEIPVEKVTPGTVAVIVKADGTEEIVKTSIPTENGVALTVDGDVTVKIIDNSKEFADVHDASHWATDSIDFVTSRELFTGKTEDSFAPNAPTTRAQLMTVLARLDGADTYTAPLQKGMEWAVENGISDGTNPDGNISRQQLAVMLWRYAGNPASGKELTNPDAAGVSDYAQAAMQWAAENGIMNGDANGNLNPQSAASRAHVAAMVARYCEKLA